MHLVLVGYGKMGHMIEQIALQRGHEIVCRIDPYAPDAMSASQAMASGVLNKAEGMIEFSTPSTASDNIRLGWQYGLPVVSGTTGWDVRALAQHIKDNALVWSSNYSVGVNILFALNRRLAELTTRFGGYTPSITETHHIHKLDAPSGTAKSLAQQIECYRPNEKVPIESIREGEIPGIHSVTWDGPVDELTLIHSAKSREGFALGAVLAAEWISGKKGFHTMEEVLGLD